MERRCSPLISGGNPSPKPPLIDHITRSYGRLFQQFGLDGLLRENVVLPRHFMEVLPNRGRRYSGG